MKNESYKASYTTYKPPTGGLKRGKTEQKREKWPSEPVSYKSGLFPTASYTLPTNLQNECHSA